MGRFLLVSLGLLVVTFSLNGIGADRPCPSDWSSFDNFCYKLIKEEKSWNDAETYCAQLQSGSHLVSFQTWREISYVKTLLSRNLGLFYTVWIGLNDPEKNRTWKWSDGSEFRYTSWTLFEPCDVNSGESCVKMISSEFHLKWEADKCESKYYFICKM